jgi:hypothetical protein
MKKSYLCVSNLKKEMDMIFDYFSCYLEGIQLCSGETTLLPAKDVLRTICDADFQNNCFDLTVTDTDVHYDYEYAKPPKDGMFLINVTRHSDGLSLLVFIDTRTTPNYIWVEKTADSDAETVCRQVALALGNAISNVANKYGWIAKIDKYAPGDPDDVNLLFSALLYVDDYNKDGIPSFYNYVKDTKRVWEIINLLHRKVDYKHKAKPIMRVFRAAYDADLLDRPAWKSVIREFKKDGQLCLASFNRYMSDENLLAKDQDYLKYLEEFKKVKRNCG